MTITPEMQELNRRIQEERDPAVLSQLIDRLVAVIDEQRQRTGPPNPSPNMGETTV